MTITTHTCDRFPARHSEPEIINDVANYWQSRGWHLRQPYNNVPGSWNLQGPFHLVAIKSGIVGRHFWGYKDLMDSTNEILKYGQVL